MSRLDKMRKSIYDAIRVNPNTEEILKELLGKAIPLIDYYDNRDIAKAIIDDAIDEGLTAFAMYAAIKEIIKSDKYNDYKYIGMLSWVNELARIQLAAERYADAVEDICFTKEV
jgi:hypothetical protein